MCYEETYDSKLTLRGNESKLDMLSCYSHHNRVEFQANLVVIDSSRIDVILGMDWLRSREAVINCGNSSVNLTTPSREKVEYVATQSASEICRVNQLKGTTVEDIRKVNEYLDGFPNELPCMPPERDIEFIIELLPRTAPIAKRPYRMGVNELAELKKQIRELLDKGYVQPSSSPWEHQCCL